MIAAPDTQYVDLPNRDVRICRVVEFKHARDVFANRELVFAHPRRWEADPSEDIWSTLRLRLGSADVGLSNAMAYYFGSCWTLRRPGDRSSATSCHRLDESWEAVSRLSPR